jgi:predicted regulator of Ras-like GTPase activity (Roadblock/LC7/MglB family)
MSSTNGLEAALAPLRDLPLVHGSFVVSDMGRLLVRDLSALFGDDVLAEVAPRALRLRETFAHANEELRACTLRYSDYLVFLRPLRDGLLCVLASAGVNVLALKMGMNLTIRRLNGMLDRPPPAAPGAGASSA